MHQLVIQFPLDTAEPSPAELDVIVALELRLERASIGDYELDGHDAGKGEVNVFILTENAGATFNAIKAQLPTDRPWRAGFRDFDSDEFSPLAPPGLLTFQIQ